MTPRILVAYATKRGSTREVAEAIAVELERDGVHAVVQSARDDVDLRTFDGVVLGGALYTGRWHRDARRFLRRHRRILTTLPVAVYGGVIDPARLRVPFNRMPPSDARDWDAIAAWADEVAGHVSDLR